MVEHLEVCEKDQAGNVIATYISSGSGKYSRDQNQSKDIISQDASEDRIDVIVRYLHSLISFLLLHFL